MNPLLLISTLFCLGAIVIIYWLHNQYRLDIQTPRVPTPPGGPLVSVIVPARNEEKNIRRCVEALLAQDYPNLQILVLDDRSTDSTSAILAELAARDSRLVILAGRELPPGWAGKPHALHQAAASATGEWLLFLDADTFLHPNAVSAALASAQKTDAGLYTVMTEQILGSFWEKAVMPLVFTALSVGFSPRKVNDPSTRDAIANGQFIFIRRAVYDAIGGHEAVKDQIVEDKAISEKVKWGGHRLVVADGRGIAQTRMYTDLASMWEGWTKNIYLGLSDRPGLLWLGAFGATLALMAALVLPAWPLLGLWWYAQGGGWMALVVIAEALLVWGYILYARAQVNRNMGISPWYALTTPLGAGVFAAMMLTSAWKVLSGAGVTWKGRKYHN
jgi:chlorobactene glucosyltransferase